MIVKVINFIKEYFISNNNYSEATNQLEIVFNNVSKILDNYSCVLQYPDYMILYYCQLLMYSFYTLISMINDKSKSNCSNFLNKKHSNYDFYFMFFQIFCKFL